MTSWNFRPADLADCSPHGLGLQISWPMRVGDQFIARLQLEREALLIYTVRYCQKTGDSSYRIGAQFCGLAATQYIGHPDEIVKALVRSKTNR
jgi:hypothetical protein